MGRVKYIAGKGLKIILNPPALNHCIIDGTASVCAKSELTCCEIGRYSYVGYQCFMVNTHIGNFCSVADNCSIGGAEHPVDFVSTSPVFHEGKNILKKNFSKHPIESTPRTIISHDVWIGRGAYLKAGITVSTGAVIGMGSIVTKNVGPYEIWAGNPAKMIRKRFEDAIIQKLLDSRWWEMNEEKLNRYALFMNDVNAFLNYYVEENGENITLG